MTRRRSSYTPQDFVGRSIAGPGWTKVFEDNFDYPVAEGGFLTTYNRWGAYPNDYRVTDNGGHYEPNNISVIDTSDGFRVMNCALKPGSATADGQPWSAAPYPKFPGQNDASALGMRVETRVRITNVVAGWHTANLTWPDSEIWPGDGEIDWMEFDFNSTIGAFLHYEDGVSGGDQASFSSSNLPTAWHVIRFEWIAGTSFKLFHDNVQIGSTITSRVPNTAHHLVLQNESTGSPTTASAIQYDWISCSKVA